MTAISYTNNRIESEVRPENCARCMPAWRALSRSWKHGPSPGWRPSGDAPPCTSWPEPGQETLSRCTWWQPSGVDPEPWRTCRSEGSVSRGRRTCLGASPGLELARSLGHFINFSLFLPITLCTFDNLEQKLVFFTNVSKKKLKAKRLNKFENSLFRQLKLTFFLTKSSKFSTHL